MWIAFLFKQIYKMENTLIGYELFVDSSLYPTSFDSSWNHKLYITKQDAENSKKDLKNSLDKSSLIVCYRPVYITTMNYGRYVLQYRESNQTFPNCLRKRVYSLKGINDYKTDLQYKQRFKFDEKYNIHRILYGEPIF